MSDICLIPSPDRFHSFTLFAPCFLHRFFTVSPLFHRCYSGVIYFIIPLLFLCYDRSYTVVISRFPALFYSVHFVHFSPFFRRLCAVSICSFTILFYSVHSVHFSAFFRRFHPPFNCHLPTFFRRLFFDFNAVL